MIKSKLVRYEQRLKTNLNKHMNKYKESIYKEFNNYSSNFDYFGFALYDEVKKKDKLKIKRIK
jgi:hypothetical protein